MHLHNLLIEYRKKHNLIHLQKSLDASAPAVVFRIELGTRTRELWIQILKGPMETEEVGGIAKTPPKVSQSP